MEDHTVSDAELNKTIMKAHTLRKLFRIIPLLLLAACLVPDIDEYSELTREMAEAVKTNAADIIYFLNEGEEEGSEPSILEDLEALQGAVPTKESINYAQEITQHWDSISKTLDALVSYSDALVSIKDSGNKGKASFNTLANSLNNLLTVTGITPVSGTVTTVGKYLFGLVTQIRAKNKLKDIIADADTVVQHIAMQLDTTLYNMIIINDVAKSQNLLKKSDSKEAQQINMFYQSLVEKEKQYRRKITLLNDYDNGDDASLKFFVYQDIPSLNKLGIKDLMVQIRKINVTSGLKPRQRLEQITSLAKTVFRERIDSKLENAGTVKSLNTDVRLLQLKQQLDFVRGELKIVAPQYHKNIDAQKHIEKTAAINEKLTLSTRKLIKHWSAYHSQMKRVLTEKQKVSFNELKLYINEVKALKAELDTLKQ